MKAEALQIMRQWHPLASKPLFDIPGAREGKNFITTREIRNPHYPKAWATIEEMWQALTSW